MRLDEIMDPSILENYKVHEHNEVNDPDEREYVELQAAFHLYITKLPLNDQPKCFRYHPPKTPLWHRPNRQILPQ